MGHTRENPPRPFGPPLRGGDFFAPLPLYINIQGLENSEGHAGSETRITYVNFCFYCVLESQSSFSPLNPLTHTATPTGKDSIMTELEAAMIRFKKLLSISPHISWVSSRMVSTGLGKPSMCDCLYNRPLFVSLHELRESRQEYDGHNFRLVAPVAAGTNAAGLGRWQRVRTSDIDRHDLGRNIPDGRERCVRSPRLPRAGHNSGTVEWLFRRLKGFRRIFSRRDK